MSVAEEAQVLAQAVEDFRERLYAEEVAEDVIGLWRDVAVHAWDAANALGDDDADA